MSMTRDEAEKRIAEKVGFRITEFEEDGSTWTQIETPSGGVFCELNDVQSHKLWNYAVELTMREDTNER